MKTAMRTVGILSQGNQSSKHKIRDIRVGTADKRVYLGSGAARHEHERRFTQGNSCLLHGTINQRRCGKARTEFHCSAGVARKKSAAPTLASEARQDATGIAQQALDHETRTRNDRAADVAPVSVDEVNGHRRADIDHTDLTIWR